MDKIEVTQADIDEATSALSNIRGYKVHIYPEHSLVQAFARHRLATRTDATPVAWMPIESAPHDEEILAAIKVRRADGQTRWERHIILIDSETGMIRDVDFYHGWEVKEYEYWQPLPAAPDHIEEPRAMVPATDVAALVEVLEWFLTGDIDVSGQALIYNGHWEQIATRIDNARQALAPFTKGQNDDA